MNGYMVIMVDYSDRFREYTVYLFNRHSLSLPSSVGAVTTVTRDTVDLNRVKIGLIVQDPTEI